MDYSESSSLSKFLSFFLKFCLVLAWSGRDRVTRDQAWSLIRVDSEAYPSYP